MLIFRTSIKVVCETKKFLGLKFNMKDLGEAEVFLGIKITRTSNGLKNIIMCIKKTNKTHCELIFIYKFLILMSLLFEFQISFKNY